MAQRSTASLGQIGMPNIPGRISIGGPNFAIDTGDAWEALRATGKGLAAQLRQKAAEAAQTKGLIAGDDYGVRVGISNAQFRDAEAGARARAAGLSPEIDAAIANAAAKYGVDANALKMIASLESGGDPAAKNPNSSAGGLFQFVDATAAQYGLGDRFDPVASSEAAARLLADNAKMLSGVLGRNPSAAELYLAHQQGGKGAGDLLGNPDAKAADIVGLEAVTLNGGSAEMSAADFAGLWLTRAGGKAAATLPAGVGSPLSLTPLQLRNDGTIYGEAFDNAAIRTYTARLTTSLNEQLGLAALEAKGDMGAYAASVAKIRDEFTKDPALADPRMRAAFEQTLADTTAGDRLHLASVTETRLRNEEVAATFEALDASRTTLERQAYNLGANGDADALLQPAINRQLRAIDGALAQGLLTPEQAIARRQAVGEGLAEQRIQGTFDALPTPAAQEQFALKLLEEWAEGKGPVAKLDYTQAKALSQTLYSTARAGLNRQGAEARAEAGRYEGLIADDIASLAATGQPLNGENGPLDVEAMNAALGEEVTREWAAARETARQGWLATAGMETETQAEIAARLALLKPVPGSADFMARSQIFEAAQKHAAELLKARAADPLGQAAAAGAIELKALDFSAPDALKTSLATRRSDVAAVKGLYGGGEISVPVFRPGEAKALAGAMIANPDELIPGFAASVTEVFGQEAGIAALAELFPEAPALALAAANSMIGGDNSVAVDIARAVAARQDGTSRVKLPAENKFAAVSGALGASMPFSAKDQAAALQVAQLLFERDAEMMGFDPGDVDKRNTIAAAAWQKALDRAVGGHVSNKIKYGGFAEINGRPVLVPADMAADVPARIVARLTPEIVAAQGAIVTGDGTTHTAGELRGGHLVAIDGNRYLLALGDPNGHNPQFLSGNGPHGEAIFDIRALDAATRDGGGFFFGLF